MKDRALVIEHDPQAVEQIEDVLAALSHEYDLAASLLQARKLMKAGKYSYVLLEVEFPTRSAGGVPRIQNAENFLKELGSNEDGDPPPVIVLCEHVAHDLDRTEDLMRLAMLLGRKGATDLIKKPLRTAGRTLDRVIRKVLAWDDVAEHLEALGAASPTAAMHDAMEQRRESFDAYLKALEYPRAAGRWPP